jgi:hypothetical protein
LAGFTSDRLVLFPFVFFLDLLLGIGTSITNWFELCCWVSSASWVESSYWSQ